MGVLRRTVGYDEVTTNDNRSRASIGVELDEGACEIESTGEGMGMRNSKGVSRMEFSGI